MIGFCLVGLCSGLLAVKYFFSFLSPVICLIFATNIYHLISISAFFLLGFWLSKYIIFSSLFICAAGIVNHVGKERIYLKNVYYNGHSWNNLELKSKKNLINFKNIKTGNKIFFSAIVKNNKGLITKIFRNNDYSPNFFQRIRNKISEFLNNKVFNEIWRAVIFGDKSFLTSEIWNRFKDSGISHLLSISGLHMQIFIFGIYRLLYFLTSLFFFTAYIPFRREILLIFSTLCGIFYNFIILPSPANIRSLIMTVVSILFPFKIDKSQVLFSIAIVMLFLDPNLILNMSFQLSFLCTFAILSKHKSLNISALSLPILSQFSLGGIFTNFFILPIFSFALYFGLVGCFLQNEFFLQIGNFFLFLIYKIAGYFAFNISILTSDFIKFLYFLVLSLTIVSRNFFYIYFPFFILVLTKIFFYFW